MSGKVGPQVVVWLLATLWWSWQGEPQVWVTHGYLVSPSMGSGKQPGCALQSRQAFPGGPEESPGWAQRKDSGYLTFCHLMTALLSLCCVPGILLDALNIVLRSVLHTAREARTIIASISQIRKLWLKQAKYQAQVTG